ncbi:Crp/Fnr family transcriptional regulator [Mucilaginibacter lappiensis]|uniref:CRP-like cAMP-binding protein n=1 Tax=Mucilaginibacter lappiensis TaxID=354630 RepID=A0A841JKZ5_9SPHI|nr:Crp/Fnr family transcriptional regulator [Mucilaginibacter lappiensis]MBB6131627.1 CRP-like cAMP-binding protein [Mucilaginibacter lappiensis]
MPNPLISYFQQFRYISDEDALLILEAFQLKSFKEGEYPFKGHRVCSEMYFVCKGVVRIATHNERGVDITHFFYPENHLCTILQSFNEGSITPTAIQACCDAEIMVITKTRLVALYTQLPYLHEVIDHVNQQHLIHKVNVRNRYLGEAAEEQYRLFVEQNPDIALRVPLKDIASYLGITPQSLSRIRKNIR